MIRSHSSLDATFMDDDDDDERAGKKTWRLSDDDDYESEDDDDEESDISEVSVTTTDNGGKSGRKRRRRRRRLRRVAAVTYDSCSVSESEKEDGALSLMMLSRGYYCSIEIGVPEGRRKKKRKKTYECATCGRAFGSYQALGGHRTSHRNGIDAAELAAAAAAKSAGVGGGSVYECLVCHKVFPSGQALGGHKRRHARA